MIDVELLCRMYRNSKLFYPLRDGKRRHTACLRPAIFDSPIQLGIIRSLILGIFSTN